LTNLSHSPSSAGFSRLCSRGGPALTAIILLGAFAAIYLRFLPDRDGRIGNDYSTFFPDMLTGYFWFLNNGAFVVPWFSPSQCAGLPFFPDPSGMFYSIPQFLVLLISPLRAVQLTVLLFALVGFAGMYGLARLSFRTSATAAVVAGALFMFNGYFATRMLVGHFSFHAFPLTAVIAACALPPPGPQRLLPASAMLRVAIMALCFAYMVHSGMFHTIPPAILACAIIMLMHAAVFGWSWFPWLALACGGLGGMALSASKMAAAVAFVSQIHRDIYLMPGIASIVELVGLVFRAVFFGPFDAGDAMVNASWKVSPWEWDFSISPVPLAIFAVVAASATLRAWRNRALPGLAVRPTLAILAAVVLLMVPLALNWYQPAWNAFIKAIPFFGNSVMLTRWFCAYGPVAIVVSAVAFDRLPLPKRLGKYGAPALAGFAIAALLVSALMSERGAYVARYWYLPDAIETAYRAARQSGAATPIQAIGEPDQNAMIGRNDEMVLGRSQPLCYAPIFGYRVERLPVKNLVVGPTLSAVGSTLNVKNPACYVFPRENNCEPGDHFSVFDRGSADAFVNYRPYPFAESVVQRVMNVVSLAALAVWIVILGVAGIWWLLAKGKRPVGA
jgi:hypothetical protein